MSRFRVSSFGFWIECTLHPLGVKGVKRVHQTGLGLGKGIRLQGFGKILANCSCSGHNCENLAKLPWFRMLFDSQWENFKLVGLIYSIRSFF